jgi:hypothetical protein
VSEAASDLRRILVEYYDGAFGPTILLGIRERSDLGPLRRVFMMLADRERETIDLLTQEFVEVRGLHALTLFLVPDGKEGGWTLQRVQDKAGRIMFRWTRDAEGWLECAEKLDGLAEATGNAEQDLADGDALVVAEYI